MRKTGTFGNLALAGHNEIFGVEADVERIVDLPLTELYPPEYHPFQVLDDAAMKRLVNSVKQYGVREPGLVRPRAEGGYELIAGNRRKRASELAGIVTMPVIIREMDDDSAAIAMVDSNLEQREKILPSEKAWAYRVKMEALNHNGVKSDMHSVDVLVEQTGESRNQIFRLIRLTELVPDLLDKVDANRLAFNPAVELSHLSRSEQASVVEAMMKYQVKPMLSQAIQLKKLSQAGELTVAAIEKVLAKTKSDSNTEKDVGGFRRFFPADYTASQMNQVITDLLCAWQKQQTA
ncbi:MAG: ParB/RepB/Spo0J family partition protein [Oscillospiraceae bacterium]|nr:ParB/RepB/Spo0J family partition protein [Oscillospiraceae bacterium]